MPKKIGLYLTSLEDMGGAVRVATGLANRFADIYGSVVVFETTSYSKKAFDLDPRVKVVPLYAQGIRLRDRFAEVAQKLELELRHNPVDVLLGIGAEETSLAIKPCKALGVPLVFCDHGALVNQLSDKSTTFLRRVCSKACVKTVVLTKRSLEDYERIMHTPHEKLACIPNCVPAQLEGKAASYDPSIKKILWAGRLDAEKGVDLLIEIAKRLLPRHEGWTWDVYGASVLGNLSFDPQAAISKAGLDGRLVLKGQVSDMYDRYTQYSIGTLTSYREGLPLFLLEAMACGLPTLSFDVATGPADIIRDCAGGFLVEPYDVDAYAYLLGALMDDEGLRAGMSMCACASVREFSEDAVLQKWIDLIKRL